MDTSDARAVSLALDRFCGQVPQYYIDALRKALSRLSFHGQRVLEIGGSSLPRELVLDTLGAAQWVCVDILNHASGSYQRSAQAAHYKAIGVDPLHEGTRIPERPYVIYDGSAADIPAAFNAKFDIVFSINSFEHIVPLEEVLDRTYKALRPTGVLFSQFGPIWSCNVGSHFWVRDGYNFNEPDPLPPWAHLRMGREELESYLRGAGLGDDDVHQTLYQLFESDFVNRRFYEEYEAAMAASRYTDVRIEGLWNREVPPEIQAELEGRHPGRKEFSAYGICISATKPEWARGDAAARSVLVCGSGRSGTSALAGLFDNGDYAMGEDLFPPSPSNPKGFYENYATNDLNEQLMARAAVAYLGSEAAAPLLTRFKPGQLWLATWPEAMPVGCTPEARRAIQALTAEQPFCLKDPRMSVTLPAWLEVCPEALALCIFRDPAVTVASIMRECQMAAYLRGLRISVDDAFAVWRQMYRRMLALYREGRKVLFVAYEDLFDASRLARLGEIAGTRLNVRFADRQLDRSEAVVAPGDGDVALLALLRGISQADFGLDRERALPLLEEFDAHHRPPPAGLPPPWNLAL